jgi:hypothetical protein
VVCPSWTYCSLSHWICRIDAGGMILGRVNDNREAIVQLASRGNENQLRLVRSVFDMGCTGY